MSCHSHDHNHNQPPASAPSTPFVSAPSSPRSSHSAPAPSTHHELADALTTAGLRLLESPPSSIDFDFGVRMSEGESQLLYPNLATSTIMSTAEELFHNGKIKPLHTSSFFSCCTCFKHAVNAGGYSCDALPLVKLNAFPVPLFPPIAAACRDVSASPQNAQLVDALPLQASRKQGWVWHDPSPPQNTEQHADFFSRGSGKHGQTEHDLLPVNALRSELTRRGPLAGRRHSAGTSRHVHAHPHTGRVPQMSSLPVAPYNNSGVGHRHHRRSRSLSPLRVFHMDDKIFQPRPSFESDRLYTHMSSRHSHAEDPVDVATTKARIKRRSRRSWTLKELLSLGVDNRVHDKRNTQIGGKSEPNPAKKRADLVNDFGLADRNMVRSPWNLQSGPVAEDYLQKDCAHLQETKKCTLLPHKKGLLACLGFTSKLSSIKGLHAMRLSEEPKSKEEC